MPEGTKGLFRSPHVNGFHSTLFFHELLDLSDELGQVLVLRKGVDKTWSNRARPTNERVGRNSKDRVYSWLRHDRDFAVSDKILELTVPTFVP